MSGAALDPQQEQSVLVEVAPLAPLPGLLTYRVPPRFDGRARAGCRVLVPLGRRTVMGVIVDEAGELGELRPAEIKPLGEVLDSEPVLPADLLALLRWTARYYLAPLGEVVRAALPPALQAQETELLRITEAGSEALAAQSAVLRRPGQDLDAKAQALLERLAASARGVTRKTLGATPAQLSRLLERGLVALSVQRRRPAVRKDLIIERVEQPAANGGAVDALLGRARRQSQLYSALLAAGGRARLGMLQGAPSGARALAHKLADKGLVRLEEVEIPRDPFESEPVSPDKPHVLNDEQRSAHEHLLGAARRGGFAAFLLQGVTGSGKTEVYLRFIADVLERGRGALVLVPEISLTPQLAARFRARFGERVAVLHSALTDAERYDQWRLIRSGTVPIVVGARSAVFAPLPDIGAVIVDEEHDSSFKQEEGLRYNARDVALVRARDAGAVCVLGSATPSLESRYGADSGRLERLVLTQRATSASMPKVEIIDLKTYRTGKDRVLSAPLATALEETLARGEQAIVFLNRRGFAPFVLCRACGHTFRCQHCSVSLTHHRSRARLVCHYCGYNSAPPEQCPACQAPREAIGMLGLGTERVEAVLGERFPEARLARLDRDTATSKGLRAILRSVGRREVDVLIGTQMVTKGHDFPDVTLVAVLCADLGLHFPDFRAAERTFQLLSQVAGRAGRGERPGRVLVQTYAPSHPSVVCARDHDYEAFYGGELEGRLELGYPPAGHLAAFRIDGADAKLVERRAREIAGSARLRAGSLGVDLLGPTEAPIQRLKGRTRWLLLLRARERRALRTLLDPLAAQWVGASAGGLRVAVDVDPIGLL
ncbi:MAG: primosomal protein N' [Myxococcales bacterium]|nr:primosomal protein N' [Myxococcales bacterium]